MSFNFNEIENTNTNIAQFDIAPYEFNICAKFRTTNEEFLNSIFIDLPGGIKIQNLTIRSYYAICDINILNFDFLYKVISRIFDNITKYEIDSNIVFLYITNKIPDNVIKEINISKFDFLDQSKCNLFIVFQNCNIFKLDATYINTFIHFKSCKIDYFITGIFSLSNHEGILKDSQITTHIINGNEPNSLIN